MSMQGCIFLFIQLCPQRNSFWISMISGKDFAVLQYLKEDYPIIKDSLVYTSGSGGVFRAGIPIGKIKSLDENNVREVDFFSDFSQLRFVKIISFKKELN